MNDPSFTGEDEELLRQNNEGKETEVSYPFKFDENASHVCNPPTGALQNSNSSVENEDDYSDGPSDSSSEDDGEPYNDPTMTLTERRAFNIVRNHKLLSSLGMMNNETIKGVSKLKLSNSYKRSNTDFVSMQPSKHEPSRGMIIPSCWALRQGQPEQTLNSSDISKSTTSVLSSLSQLQQRYPHQSKQIRKLFSLISVPIHTSTKTTTNSPFVPPPTTS